VAFRSRVFQLIEDEKTPKSELAILSVASSALDRLHNDADRILGQQVRGGAEQGAQAANWKWIERHGPWQGLAEEIWLNEPQLSKLEVARRIGQTTGDKTNTIRHIIKRPLSQS
jgi:hypothetical protein